MSLLREATRSPVRHILLLVVCVVCAESFQNPADLLIISFIGIYGTAALGLNMMLGLAGLLSIGQAAMMALGAYGTVILVAHTGMPLLLACLLGVILATTVSGLVTLLAIRVRSHYYILTTVGIAEITLVVAENAKGLTGGDTGIALVKTLSFGPVSLSTPRALAIAALVLLMVGWYVADQFQISRIGRLAKVIGANEELGAVCGMSVTRGRLAVGLIGGGFAGAAGALIAVTLLYVGPSDFDLSTALLLVVMVVIGGMASNAGVVVGAVIFTYISYGLLQLGALGPLIYGVAVIALMLVAPGGIAALVRGGAERVASLARSRQ